MDGNISMRNLERQNSFPIRINFTQQVQDDRQASVIIFDSSFLTKLKIETIACQKKKYNNVNLVTKEDLGKISSERK